MNEIIEKLSEKELDTLRKIAKRNKELDDKFYRTIWKKLGVEE